MEKGKLRPKISVIICSSNKDKLANCLRSLKAQDYPKDRIQTLIMTGFMPEGVGGGKWRGWKEAKGEYVLILDEDNELQGKDVLSNMVYPLEDDKTIFGSHCMLRIMKKDPLINTYISLIGTDPVFAYRSLDGSFNDISSIKKLDNRERYYVHTMNMKNLLVTGGNCFLYRKSFVDSIGGYTQDTDNIYVYTKIYKHIKIAIPKLTLTHHKAAKNMADFLKKKMFWSRKPTSQKWKWIPEDFSGKAKFFGMILCNLTVVNNMYHSIRNTFKYREPAWMLHPFMAFATTMIYGFNFIRRLK
jgi:cellulose synthase/poly-beta-1,6-N-acetylglucosamine synthase-like glycosyltransferase